jgi:two-component system sensor histidine kinase MtrB
MAADVLYSARDEFDPAMRRAAELLQTEVDRFESLLVDLLEISRYDAGFAVLEAEPTDVRQLVRHTVEFMRTLAERAGTPVRVAIPDYPIIAEVDPRRVGRILRNLIGNAVEHGEGRPVEIALVRDVRAVAITVRDHGVGFKPGEAQIVFNRFWRADPSRARQTGGTGLGLSISLEDARLHGGWLQAWGEPGKGAQFRLTLPLDAGVRLTASPLPLVPADAVAGPESVPAGPVPGGPLSGGPLSGVPLSGVPMPGVPLSGVPMPGVPLSGVPLSGVPMPGVPMPGARSGAVEPEPEAVPVSGVPVSGVPVSGVAPVSGVPDSGGPASGVAPVSGVPVSAGPASEVSGSGFDLTTGEIVTGAGGRRG